VGDSVPLAQETAGGETGLHQPGVRVATVVPRLVVAVRHHPSHHVLHHVAALQEVGHALDLVRLVREGRERREGRGLTVDWT